MQAQSFLNYVNGQWVAAQSKATLSKWNPFDGSLLGEVALSDAMDVILALPSAKQAQQNFEKSTLAARAQMLDRIAEALTAKASDYALWEATHQGLSQKFVLEKSVHVSVEFFKSAAAQCRAAEKDLPLAAPVGLVSIISSWCLSLRLISERLAPALAAGNGVFIKISELSPVTAQILAEVLEKAAVPAGLVQLLQGAGADVGAVLAGHPSIRAVSFVGQMSTAEKIIRAAAGSFKKIQIASGAKNSLLILNDVDFKAHMPNILQSFLMGQGQLCWNSHRLFVTESVREEFIHELKLFLGSLRPAKDPTSDSLWMPVIEKERVTSLSLKNGDAQKEHAKILQTKAPVDGEGADILAGNTGFFVRPSFTLDLTNCSVLQQDEIPGPLFIVTAVKYAHEMVKWSNTGYYGHSAVIWGPAGKLLKPSLGLQVSQVWTNDWMPATAAGGDAIAGQKNSVFGNTDLRPFGSFFSDVKTVTGLSKSQSPDDEAPIS